MADDNIIELDMEDAVEFVPDDRLLSGNEVEELTGIPTDVYLFQQAQNEGLQIFKRRRDMYGDHFEKARRFPKYLDFALYIKCVRIIEDIERGETPSIDTLIDTANYCHMIRSVHE